MAMLVLSFVIPPTSPLST